MQDIKIDVAVQSYKKPESLIYTLLTLKKYCGNHIDRIYIQDDCSGNRTIEKYTSSKFQEAMSPIAIEVYENAQNCSIYYYEQKAAKKLHNKVFYLLYQLRNITPKIIEREDVRYQHAIDTTDKNYLMLIHDDIEFTGDVIQLYLDNITDSTAIIGDLGQCWRCPLSSRCNPQLINNGIYPKHSCWPITYCFDSLKNISKYKFEKRACRINEWCCLINVEIAKKLAKDSIFFGAYEDLGDIGAYWFDEIIKRGYSFNDPLAPKEPIQGQEMLDPIKSEYYIHCWQGFSGHSIWTNQGSGKNEYPKEMIIKRLINEFGYYL